MHTWLAGNKIFVKMQANFKQKVYKQKIVLEFLLFLFFPQRSTSTEIQNLDNLLHKVNQISRQKFDEIFESASIISVNMKQLKHFRGKKFYPQWGRSCILQKRKIDLKRI